jgi:hypothetical protein
MLTGALKEVEHSKFSQSHQEGRREHGRFSLHLKTVMRISKRERSDKPKIRSQGSAFYSQMHMQLQMWLKSEGFFIQD